MIKMFFDFPETWQLNLGQYVGNFVRWLVQNYTPFFDAIKGGILWFLLQTRDLFLWIPWPIVLIFIFVLGWKIKIWKSGVMFSILIFTIGIMGLWDEMMLTLSVVLVSVVIACIIAVPLG